MLPRRTVMPASPASLQRQPPVHSHELRSQCPYCDQPIPAEQAEEIRHRIEAKERDQAEKLSVKIRQELAWETAHEEAVVQERIATLEAANAAAREEPNKRVALAEQQTRAVLSQYEALLADQERIVTQRLQD